MQVTRFPHTGQKPRIAAAAEITDAALMGRPTASVVQNGRALVSTLNDADEKARREREADRKAARTHDALAAPTALDTAANAAIAAERNLDRSSKSFRRRENTASLQQSVSDKQQSFHEALAQSSAARAVATHGGSSKSAPGAALSVANPHQPEQAGAAAQNSSGIAAPTSTQGPTTTPRTPNDFSQTASLKSPQPPSLSAAKSQMPPPPAGPTDPASSTSSGEAPSPTAPAGQAATAISQLAAIPAPGNPANSTQAGGPSNASSPAAKLEPTLAAAAVDRGDAAANRITGARTKRGAEASAIAEPDTRRSDAQVAQLVRVLRSRMNSDHSNIVMRLDPAALGGIRISMQMHKESMSLEIDTESRLAHRLLTDQADSLRNALEASGITLERFEVRPPVDAPANSGSHDSQHGRNENAADGSQHGRDGSAGDGGQLAANANGGGGGNNGSRPHSEAANANAEHSRSQWELESRPALASSEAAGAILQTTTRTLSLNLWA